MRSEGSPEAATQYLLRNNVRGIKYLDQGSRDVGKGTSNFVVFDPKDLEILRILGLAGVAVGSAGLMGRASSNAGQTVPYTRSKPCQYSTPSLAADTA